MVMRRIALGLLSVLTMLSCFERAQAASVIQSFFSGEDNLASDNSAEFLFNRAGGVTDVDVGDVLITWFQVNSLEKLTGLPEPTKTFGGAGDSTEWTGVAAIEVLTKVAGTGPGRFDYTFGAVSTGLGSALADISANGTLPITAAEIASWAPTTVVAFYDDPAKNFSRLSPDDGAPDTGVGPFAAEDTLLATANGGTRILELGFLLQGDSATEQTFWVANDAVSDISAAGAIPAPGSAGSVDAGLNVTFNAFPGTVQYANVPTLNPLTFALGTSDWSISAGLVGIGGAITPGDVFDNFDAVFQPQIVPEPSMLSIFAIGGVVVICGHCLNRRRNKGRKGSV